MYLKSLYFLLFLIASSQCDEQKSYSELNSCDIGPLATEIASYQSVVNNIIQYAVSGPFKGKTYYELARFVDKFGARISGSDVLEKSITHLAEILNDEFIDHIVTEYVKVPHWKRGEEKLTMLQPRTKNMALLGLGPSVTTPPEGITAEVIVISNFTHLDDTSEEEIKGKIVLYNPVYMGYDRTVQYRTHGASKAAAKGAVAALVRSITPFSINSPHTGFVHYDDNVGKIPTAAITLEDANLIERIIERGEKIVLKLTMNSTYTTNISRNTVIDLKGTHDPEKVVIISAHADTWDVGQGAMDDGGGLLITWAALSILKRLDLTPKRTVRGIIWTAEEFAYVGARAYEQAHRNEADLIDFIMESDEGTFAPLGLAVGGTHQARCVIAEILKLFKSINATTLIEEDAPGSDISIFIEKGIPGASLYNDNGKYFWYHHTEADTMDVESPENLDLGAAFWAAVTYVIADISEDIPR